MSGNIPASIPISVWTVINSRPSRIIRNTQYHNTSHPTEYPSSGVSSLSSPPLLPVINGVEAQTEGADRTVTSIVFIHRSYPVASTASSRHRSSLDQLTKIVVIVCHLHVVKSGAIRFNNPLCGETSLLTCILASAVSRAGSSPSPPSTRLICHPAISTNAVTRPHRTLPGHIGLRYGKLVMVRRSPSEIAR